jgi:hypothetical protein
MPTHADHRIWQDVTMPVPALPSRVKAKILLLLCWFS